MREKQILDCCNNQNKTSSKQTRTVHYTKFHFSPRLMPHTEMRFEKNVPDRRCKLRTKWHEDARKRNLDERRNCKRE